MKTKLLIIIGISMIVVGFSVNQIIIGTLPPHYPRPSFISMQTFIPITAIFSLMGIPVTITGIIFIVWRKRK